MKHLTFDVGTNFDKNLINVIAENNKNNQFSSVFGKLKTDFGWRTFFSLFARYYYGGIKRLY